MKNIFAELKKKLTRREKKGKPVPVPHKAPIRQEPEPAEPKIKAVTYNRADGRVSGGELKSVYWDEGAKVYKGTNYFVQAQEADRLMREQELKLRKSRPVRYDDYGGDDFSFYADSTTFDEAFFHQSEETRPERGYTAPESPLGYDYPRETVSPVYEAPRTSYEAPASTTAYDTGSSSASTGYSSSGYSDSGSGSSSYSDSGSSSGGGYSGD